MKNVKRFLTLLVGLVFSSMWCGDATNEIFMDPKNPSIFYTSKDVYDQTQSQEALENAHIATDLNDVVFPKYILSSVPWILWDIIKGSGMTHALWTVLALPQLLREQKVTEADNTISKRCWDQILASHDMAEDPLEPYIGTLKKATAGFSRLDPDMARLLQKLKDEGHETHYFTNMGETILESLCAKVEAERGIYNTLDDDTFKNTLDFLRNHDGSFASSAENGWSQKPNPNAYKAYFAKHPDNKKITIFIDDKEHNIRTGLQDSHFDVGIKHTTPAETERALSSLRLSGFKPSTKNN